MRTVLPPKVEKIRQTVPKIKQRDRLVVPVDNDEHNDEHISPNR